MPQKKLAREIILAVCENTQLPVSLKIRAGVGTMSAKKFIENTCDLPYSAVMLHVRTYEGSFSGPVDFKLAENIKKIIPDKIVLGNGGIYTPEDAQKILTAHPLLDGLGIARGAWGRPFIFKQIKELLKKGNYTPYNFSQIKKIMLEHARLIYKDKDKLGLFEIRKHMTWYVKGWPGAAELRRRLVLAMSLKEIKEILK
jgi:tRNA-dihydrouridine synthase